MEGEQKLDHFGPGFIAAWVAALFGDVFFLIALPALAIPVVGIALAAILGLGVHYLTGIIIAGLVFSQLKHFLPKLVLGLAILLPLPFLMVGLGLALILQNRFIEFIVTQAAIAAVGVVTGGAGVVAGEAAAVTARGTQAATTMVKTTQTTRAVGTAERAGGIATQTGRAIRTEEELASAGRGGTEAAESMRSEESLVKLRRIMEELPEPEKRREEKSDESGVFVDERQNQVNLRHAA